MPMNQQDIVSFTNSAFEQARKYMLEQAHLLGNNSSDFAIAIPSTLQKSSQPNYRASGVVFLSIAEDHTWVDATKKALDSKEFLELVRRFQKP